MDKNQRRLFSIFLSCLFFAVILSGTVAAVNVGVSPATVNFKNVLRGGYAEGSVVVSVDSVNKTNITVNALGNISSWLNFTHNFSVSKNNPRVLTISVTPPNDTPNGNYTGFVNIETASLGSNSQGKAVGIVRSTLDVYVTVEVVDTQIIQCAASQFGVHSVEKGSNAVFLMNVTNQGNVILNPLIKIDIWNEGQTQIVKSIDVPGGEILPTMNKRISVSVNTGSLGTSQYWAQVSVPDCLASKLLTFDVLEPGALTAEGVLIGILSPKQAKAGETIPIEASFKNTGEKTVSAQFQGEITKSGRIVQLLNSPASEVTVGNIGVFDFYFTPQSAGDYIISGRVFYSGKRTYETSTTVNVSQKSFFYSVVLPAIYGILVVLIAFLFLKVIKERRSLKKILRGIRK